MSVNHVERITSLVKATLKKVSLGEPHGYSVSMGYVLCPHPETNEPQLMVGWTIAVTIRNTANLQGQDIGVAIPIGGVLPPDQIFEQATTFLFQKCMEERDRSMDTATYAVTSGPVGAPPRADGIPRGLKL